ncbi:FERM central domain [Carpediemonas membranifera]|uniref:FERM central domain n=1 Tax=Carpediemonas membranifera TaxID=201153 RepID=A0A8J6E3Y3_9EUKA|nr:FERM central domain [Carpediemonas membranifera]|eukprot:KAG9396533.1 FERM central domain [Carpediemonas membranifera]
MSETSPPEEVIAEKTDPLVEPRESHVEEPAPQTPSGPKTTLEHSLSFSVSSIPSEGIDESLLIDGDSEPEPQSSAPVPRPSHLHHSFDATSHAEPGDPLGVEGRTVPEIPLDLQVHGIPEFWDRHVTNQPAIEPSTPGGGTKPIMLTVVFPDKAHKLIPADTAMTGTELLELAAEKVGLRFWRLYSLRKVTDSHRSRGRGYEQFVDLETSIGSQGVTTDMSVELTIRDFIIPKGLFRYKPSAKDTLASDELAVEYLYNLVKDNIISGQWPISETDAVDLAARQLLVEVGRYDPVSHTVGYLDRLDVTSYIPKALGRLLPSAYWQGRIFTRAESIPDADKLVHRMSYIRHAVSTPYFGITLFHMTDVTQAYLHKSVYIGTAMDGLFVFDPATMVPASEIKWDQILSVENGFARMKIVYEYTAGRIPESRELVLEESDGGNSVHLSGSAQSFRAFTPDQAELVACPPFRYFKILSRTALGVLKGVYVKRAMEKKQPLLSDIVKAIDIAIDTKAELDKLSFDPSVTPKSFEQFIQAVEETQTIMAVDPHLKDDIRVRTLILDRCKLTYESAPLIKRILLALDSVTIFKVIKVPISNKGVMSLARTLDEVHVLVLDTVDLGNKGCEALANAMKLTRTVTELVLPNNRITDTSLTRLSECILLCPLARLDLSNNRFTAAGLDAISSAVAQCTSLTEMSIANNRLGAASLPAIFRCVSHSASLSKVNLSGNHLGPSIIGHVTDMVDLNHARIRSWDLANNALGDKAARQVAFMLRKTLAEEVIMDSNGLSQEGMTAVAEKFAESEHMVYLQMSGNKRVSGGLVVSRKMIVVT